MSPGADQSEQKPDGQSPGGRPVAAPAHPGGISALLTHEKHLQGVVKWKTPVPEQHEECDSLYVNKKQALKIGVNIHIGQ